MDSRCGTVFKEKKMEGVGTAKTYMKGNCEGDQSPPGAVEPRKKNELQ
jgi:hypothetical protein